VAHIRIKGGALMDLINMKVSHKIFGDGIIIKNDDSYITVKFSEGEKKFGYPNAFDGYLSTEDTEFNNKVKEEIEAIIRLEEEKKEEIAKKEKENLEVATRKEEKKERKVKVYPRENIAFKCNYCDGGKSDKEIGFNGVCSNEIIKNNIEIEQRTWCSSKESDCLSYLNREISRLELDSIHNDGGYVCYESQMLREWKAMAGIVQRGERAGQPMKLNKVQNNSLCVLTTRLPNTREEDRFIFGVFLVDENYEGDNFEEGYVSTKSKYKIKLSPKEAEGMLFWSYHANENQSEVARWSSGLHRYFNDEQAIQILRDLALIKEGTEDEELAEEFLQYFARINGIDIDSVTEKNGALMRNGI
jgi:hypothetical protein